MFVFNFKKYYNLPQCVTGLSPFRKRTKRSTSTPSCLSEALSGCGLTVITSTSNSTSPIKKIGCPSF